MLDVERKIAIVNKITRKKTVTVNDLADMLKVAKTTIRKDLSELEQNGVLTRIHGGAILNEDYIQSIDYNKKQVEEPLEKLAIAKKAVTLIEPNSSIALNTSTITTLIAQELPNEPFTVVTNSLDVSEIIAKKDKISLITTGGNFITKHRSFEGHLTARAFSEFTYHISFIGTNGIHTEQGISTSTFLESNAKQTIINNSIQSIVVAEPGKFERIGLMKVASLEDISGIVTTQELSDEIKSAYFDKVKIYIA